MSDSQGFSFPDSESLSGQPHYGGFWWRFLASFIDGFICQFGAVLIVLVPTILLSLVLAFSGASKDTVQMISNSLGAGVGWLTSWLYFALMESSAKQATLGKQICRLKVMSKQGERLSFSKASARHWARIAHSLTFALIGLICFGLLGIIFLGGPKESFSQGSINSHALGGFLGLLLGGMVGACLGSIAGYLPALWTPQKQTLHDLIAGTVVVRKIKETPFETVVSVPLSQDL